MEIINYEKYEKLYGLIGESIPFEILSQSTDEKIQ